MGKIKSNLSRYIPILIVAFGGAVIYGLPYFRYDYYDAYVKVYNLTDTQMGVFGSILGVFGMISYLFGGIVADRFSTRTILTVSLVGTGLGGFIHLLPLNFTELVCLYAFWGVSSLFAFWPCCVKAVRMLSDSENQGKAFGFFEGGRGVAAALMAMGAIVAYKFGIGSIDDQVKGMKFAIIYYSVLTILMGVFTFFVVKNEKMEESEKVSFKGIGELLRMPAVWIVGFITFFTYMFTQLFFYFTPYLTDVLGASVTIGAVLAASKRWFSLFGNVGGGIATDKVGTTRMIFFSFIAIAIGVGVMIVLPGSKSIVIPFIILYLLVYIFYNVNLAITWALMDEGGIPERLSGSAAGLISTIGYLPEIFCSLMAGKILDAYSGETGYKIIFAIIIAAMLLGAALTIVWKKVVTNKIKEN